MVFPAFLAKLEDMALIHQTSIMVTVSWMQTAAAFKGVSELQFPPVTAALYCLPLCVITTDRLTSVQTVFSVVLLIQVLKIPGRPETTSFRFFLHPSSLIPFLHAQGKHTGLCDRSILYLHALTVGGRGLRFSTYALLIKTSLLLFTSPLL